MSRDAGSSIPLLFGRGNAQPDAGYANRKPAGDLPDPSGNFRGSAVHPSDPSTAELDHTALGGETMSLIATSSGFVTGFPLDYGSFTQIFEGVTSTVFQFWPVILGALVITIGARVVPHVLNRLFHG